MLELKPNLSLKLVFDVFREVVRWTLLFSFIDFRGFVKPSPTSL